MAGYLCAVSTALARRGCDVQSVQVRAHPQEALSGTLELERAVRVPDSRSTWMHAGWNEELGWWAEPATDLSGPGPRRRWLDRGDTAPYPTVAADFLAGLARGEDVGALFPTVHRYHLLGARQELLFRLGAHAERFAGGPDRDLGG